MLLTDFEPGDGTRYIVGYEILMAEQGRKMGHGTDPACLFLFGTSEDMHCFTFHVMPRAYLTADYYASKMRLHFKSDHWTICAGMHVLGALTSRTIACALSVEQMEWQADWKDRIGAHHVYNYEYIPR